MEAAQLAQPAQQGQQVLKELGLLEPREQLDLAEPQVLPGLQELLVRLALLALQELQELLERLVLKVQLALKEL